MSLVAPSVESLQGYTVTIPLGKEMKSFKKKIVYAAISGGVDSAVAAALLKDCGYDVHGIFLREYDLSLPSAFGDAIECTQEGDRRSALAVAAELDIPFEEWDFRHAYHKAVISYLVREYRSGRTPNPDIMCNSVIKFGLFLKRALKEGADYIATGHYAKRGFRVQGSGYSKKLNAIRYTLNASCDSAKDQTYFLSRLTQEQLRHCLFPIGNLLKPEVRAKAKALGLPNWNRKDSQGVCFIGKLSMRDFLKIAIPHKKGPLMTREGERVGTHEGSAFFTIGQRHGLGFAGGEKPYYVVDKDMRKNIVVVDHKQPSSELYKKELTCSAVHWISGKESMLPLRCRARVRYRQVLQSCTVTHVSKKHNRYRVIFARPQRAITPGQSVVFYRGQECLGGGIID